LNKKFPIVLSTILLLSAILLGFSYAKEAGATDYVDLITEDSLTKRVIYSNDKKILVNDADGIQIRVINKSNLLRTYYLEIENKEDIQNQILYYTVDGEEKHLLENFSIYLGTLEAYGFSNDSLCVQVKVFSSKKTISPLMVTVKEMDM